MFIIDFDNTLFDTPGFRSAMKKVFFDYGVPEEDFKYSENLAVHGRDGNHFDYTLELHLQILREKGHDLPDHEVISLINSQLDNSYVYDDTIFFLEELKKQNRRMILLTAGNEKFQLMKIHSVKIEDYFDEIICVRGKKEEYVESVYTPHEKIFFINDKLKENIDVKNKRGDICIITKRNPLRNSKEELENSGIPYFETLTEILNYINQYGQE